MTSSTIQRSPRKSPILRALAILAITVLPLFSPAPPAYADGATDEAERVLEEAARALGWSTNVLTERGSISTGLRGLLTAMHRITPTGTSSDGNPVQAAIMVADEKAIQEMLAALEESGAHPSSYQGRQAVVLQPGERVCDAGGMVGLVVGLLRRIVSEIAPAADTSDICGEAHGLIAWSCGSYLFIASDATDRGLEHEIAAALYQAAEKDHLCDMGDTLVILADTDDQPGATRLGHYQEIAQQVNSYYGQNAYGRVAPVYTFLDADGPDGPSDWYRVAPSKTPYARDFAGLATAVVKKALEGGGLPEEVNLARIIIVYSGPSQQVDPTQPIYSHCQWKSDGHFIEVGDPAQPTKVYVPNIIMLAEADSMGVWAHEVGHSLYAKYDYRGQDAYRVSDRYNYAEPWGQNGAISYWGLMGLGCHWGAGATPSHMCAYSKESAEWLSYTPGRIGLAYNLTAIENMRLGDAALTIDDPTSVDPRVYYIVEARDASGAYGAPESGVVLYRVTYDRTNDHAVVNVLSPQAGDTTRIASGVRITRATLQADAPRWVSPEARFAVALESASESPYAPVVRTEVFTPTNLVGARVAPAGPPVVPPAAGAAGRAPGYNTDDPLPDIDLHAYDDQGRHVGLNYDTMQYEHGIPGALASGNLKDDAEWIYVPDTAQVRFEVSAVTTQRFLEAFPEYADVVRPHEYSLTLARIDHEGNVTEADAGAGQVGAGATAPLTSPDDPDLDYRRPFRPGYDRNLTSGLYLGLTIAFIVLSGLIGGLVARARG